MSSSESDSDIEKDIELEHESIVNRLTELVRRQYRSRLEKLLYSNYEVWCEHELGFKENPLSQDIVKCAEIYEEKAIKSCMIAQLYRKSMLRIMGKIQEQTQSATLSPKLEVLIQSNLKRSQYVEASTQTDTQSPPNGNLTENCSLSLDEKIEKFKICLKEQKQNERPQRRRKRDSTKDEKNIKNLKRIRRVSKPPKSNEKLTSVEVTPPQVPRIEDDDIAKELDMLFKEEKTVVDEIFGSPEELVDPHMASVLREIEECQLRQIEEAKLKAKTLPPTPTPNEDDLLKDSLWPCELHHQQMLLREILSQASERDWSFPERIKSRFLELFGDDDEDEFAPYSPTLELNEVLLASCKKRIAPWVVKNLMPSLNGGRIADRILFKKLAKRLAHSIILDNQYPDETFIIDRIDEFFYTHQGVISIQDIDVT